jgi:peroxiredoxin
MKSLLLFAILLFGFTFAAAQNEQAPVIEKEIKYKDWTYKNVLSGEEINLRSAVKSKKLVMVVYFAAWCPNWKHEAPFAERMYEKYKANGFDVIGIAEYDTIDNTKTSMTNYKITFPVVLESDNRSAKQTTLHYEYRRYAGDTRNWGSPWNLFIDPAHLEKKGDELLKKAFVVNGELIEADAEKFIRERLGLPREETKTGVAAREKEIEACEPDKKSATFIKP